FALGVIIIVRSFDCSYFLFSLLLLLFSSFLWGRDVHREGCYEGNHNFEVTTGFKIGIPFLNTILLVSSGVSVTWTHHAIENGEFDSSIISLFLTVLLGATFTSFQLLEYYVASFTFSCSCYSSVYFMGTGFHGLHVLIGSVLLLICLEERSSAFECGFDSITPTGVPFSIPFFVISLIFLLFDVEILLLLFMNGTKVSCRGFNQGSFQ
ncbi:Cytochrome c oxidase subunit 3, partial [Golovinomyces cichoracearum]